MELVNKVDSKVNVTVKNGNVVEECEDTEKVNLNGKENICKSVINEAVPLEDTVAVNGNIYAGNVIRGEVVEIDPNPVF